MSAIFVAVGPLKQYSLSKGLHGGIEDEKRNNEGISIIPYAPCVVYVPSFTIRINVRKYSIHGPMGSCSNHVQGVIPNDLGSSPLKTSYSANVANVMGDRPAWW